MRYLTLYAVGCLAFGAFLIYGVFAGGDPAS